MTFQVDQYYVSFAQYDVISFGSFVGSTGDVEGRLAVRDNLIVGAGFSVGYEITAPDAASNPLSMIVGRDAIWGSGTVYPSNVGLVWIGGDFNAPDYLQTSLENPNTPCYGCLDSAFDAVKSCYDSVVSDFSSRTPNTEVQIVPYTGGQLQITCDDNTENVYVTNLPDTLLNQASAYSLVNCNSNAEFIIVVTGTGNVTFHGSPFPSVPNGATYVIDCSEVQRGVALTVGVNGGIIAPDCSHLQETGGAVWGKVVSADITYMVQFNRPCAYGIAE